MISTAHPGSGHVLCRQSETIKACRIPQGVKRTFIVELKKVLFLHIAPVNLNNDENTLCIILFNDYYHLSDSGGITFAIFPPVRRTLPAIIQ
jgi:hypothetical protein